MRKKTEHDHLLQWFPLRNKESIGKRQGNRFRPQFIDFQRGIRVGHLDEDERITRILKIRLNNCFGRDFVIDRWGRGVFWQYIWFTPRETVKNKKRTGRGNFSQAKYFIAVDKERKILKSGFFIESGLEDSDDPRFRRNPDWHWNRFCSKLIRDKKFQKELKRLIKEDEFVLEIGFGEQEKLIDRKNFKSATRIAQVLKERALDEWTVVQIFYPMTPADVNATSGVELINAFMAVFIELVPVINASTSEPLVQS